MVEHNGPWSALADGPCLCSAPAPWSHPIPPPFPSPFSTCSRASWSCRRASTFSRRSSTWSRRSTSCLCRSRERERCSSSRSLCRRSWAHVTPVAARALLLALPKGSHCAGHPEPPLSQAQGPVTLGQEPGFGGEVLPALESPPGIKPCLHPRCLCWDSPEQRPSLSRAGRVVSQQILLPEAPAPQ